MLGPRNVSGCVGFSAQAATSAASTAVQHNLFMFITNAPGEMGKHENARQHARA
jgi:hypothetical protein